MNHFLFQFFLEALDLSSNINSSIDTNFSYEELMLFFINSHQNSSIIYNQIKMLNGKWSQQFNHF